MTLTWGQQYSKKDAIKYLQKVAGLLLKIVKQLKHIIVKSKQDVPYHHWLLATSMIEDAGGIITIQREEERKVLIPE